MANNSESVSFSINTNLCLMMCQGQAPTTLMYSFNNVGCYCKVQTSTSRSLKVPITPQELLANHQEKESLRPKPHQLQSNADRNILKVQQKERKQERPSMGHWLTIFLQRQTAK